MSTGILVESTRDAIRAAGIEELVSRLRDMARETLGMQLARQEEWQQKTRFPQDAVSDSLYPPVMMVTTTTTATVAPSVSSSLLPVAKEETKEKEEIIVVQVVLSNERRTQLEMLQDQEERFKWWRPALCGSDDNDQVKASSRKRRRRRTQAELLHEQEKCFAQWKR